MSREQNRIKECPRWADLFRLRRVCDRFHCLHNLREGKLGKNGKVNEYLRGCHSCDCLILRNATLQDIGEIWGLSRERIRQIEEKALKKIFKREK